MLHILSKLYRLRIITLGHVLEMTFGNFILLKYKLTILKYKYYFSKTIAREKINNSNSLQC